MAGQQFFRHANSQNEGIVLAHTMYGQPSVEGNYAAQGSVGPEGSTIQRSTYSVMAAYVTPEEKLTQTIHTERRCKGKDGTCKGFPMKDLDYCSGHARSLGLVENWNKNGRMSGDAG